MTPPGKSSFDVTTMRNHAGDAAQQVRVARADRVAPRHLPLEMRQFGQQNGGLQGVEAPVHAQQRVVVPLETPVRPDGAHLPGEFVVEREDRPDHGQQRQPVL